MLYRFPLCFLLLLLATVTSAQITGKIVDATGQAPLEYATAALYDQSSEQLITGVITDLDGNFNMEGVKKAPIILRLPLWDIAQEWSRILKSLIETLKYGLEP